MGRAADELGVTHGAVSRHVRILEANLGVGLFDRGHGRIRLSAQGSRLLPVVQEAFDRVTEAALNLDATSMAGRLTVAATPNLAASWLIPQLDGFLRQYPALDLDVRMIEASSTELEDGIDLAIVYGLPKAPGRRVVRLSDISFFPVWSPRYENAVGSIRSPADLCDPRTTLLHDDGGDNWARWFDAVRSTPGGTAGDRSRRHGRNVHFSSALLSLEAARASLGIALGGRLEVADDLATGRLLRLSGHGAPAPHSYYLVTSAEPPRRALEFETWLRAQLSA